MEVPKKPKSTKIAIYDTAAIALFPFTTQCVGRVIKHAKQVPGGLQPRTALDCGPIQNESHAMPVPEPPGAAWVFLSCLNGFIHQSERAILRLRSQGGVRYCRPSKHVPTTAATMPVDRTPTGSRKCLTLDSSTDDPCSLAEAPMTVG